MSKAMSTEKAPQKKPSHNNNVISREKDAKS
jgi:hypothetical protein